jgi:hypothetical protein
MNLGEVHPLSPKLGDVVKCTNPDRKLNDPKGYKVEYLGWSELYGHTYGTFSARGVQYGGLYRFSVYEFSHK